MASTGGINEVQHLPSVKEGHEIADAAGGTSGAKVAGSSAGELAIGDFS